MHKIVFLDRSSLPVPLRAPRFPHEWREFPDTSPDELVGRLADATIAVTDRVFIPGSALRELPELKHIAVAATGVDGIDLAACRELDITVSNCRDWAVCLPEHVFALILALRRNLVACHDAIRGGAWQRSDSYLVQVEPVPQALHGSTLGIVGHGFLGQSVARLAEAFGMKVVVADRKEAHVVRPGRLAFADVLGQSDVLVVLCPLTPETKGMIGARELSLMRRTALLINCARGGIVDEAALAAALKRGDLAGAGVDVLEQEPPRDGSPLLDLKQDNLIVTPHVAWVSEQSLQALAEQVVANLESFAAGAPRNLVN